MIKNDIVNYMFSKLVALQMPVGKNTSLNCAFSQRLTIFLFNDNYKLYYTKLIFSNHYKKKNRYKN